MLSMQLSKRFVQQIVLDGFAFVGILNNLLDCYKYRRQIIYGRYKAEIGKILRTICERYDVEILEAQACVDHIHMLVSIAPKMSVSRFMGI